MKVILVEYNSTISIVDIEDRDYRVHSISVEGMELPLPRSLEKQLGMGYIYLYDEFFVIPDDHPEEYKNEIMSKLLDKDVYYNCVICRFEDDDRDHISGLSKRSIKYVMKELKKQTASAIQ